MLAAIRSSIEIETSKTSPKKPPPRPTARLDIPPRFCAQRTGRKNTHDSKIQHMHGDIERPTHHALTLMSTSPSPTVGSGFLSVFTDLSPPKPVSTTALISFGGSGSAAAAAASEPSPAPFSFASGVASGSLFSGAAAWGLVSLWSDILGVCFRGMRESCTGPSCATERLGLARLRRLELEVRRVTGAAAGCRFGCRLLSLFFEGRVVGRRACAFTLAVQEGQCGAGFREIWDWRIGTTESGLWLILVKYNTLCRKFVETSVR